MTNPKRDPLSQGEHDRIIKEIARTRVNLDKYRVETNLGRSGIHRVVDIQVGQQMFPDVIVRDRHTGEIHTLYEVETGESVNHKEAQHEWKLYGSIGCKFILVVPMDRVRRACELIEEHHVDIDRLEAYEVDSQGRIDLDVLNPPKEGG